VSYRVGSWAAFKESLLARLSSSDYAALASLKTRDNDDFTIAFLDATAVVLDILTFYQERLANENYLRTATQLRSLTELSRLIGYQPAPGVSSAVCLAFTLKTTPGSPPDPSTPAITIPKGTQVQSVPAQGQTPQTFETSADISAKPNWNALAVEAARPWRPPGRNGLYLEGVATQLNPGDSLLILGFDRDTWDPSSPNPNEQWDVVVLNQVLADTRRNITFVSWEGRLDHGSGDGTSGPADAWTTSRVFAFRQKAALFGNNAPDPNLFVNAKNNKKTSLPLLIDDSSTPWQWRNPRIADSDHVDLDSAYPKIVPGGWFALVDYGSVVQLYKVKSASSISRADYGISAKITRLAADYEDPDIEAFDLRGTAVLSQSEELMIARQPLDFPLYGTVVDLEEVRPDLVGIQAVALSGTGQKLILKTPSHAPAPILVFVPDDNSASQTLNPGDNVTVIDPAPLPLEKDGEVPHWNRHSTQKIALRVADSSGRTGTLIAALADFTLAATSSDDPIVQESALVASVSVVTHPFPHTRIKLQNKLAHCYNRDAARVNCNVGLASAGRSVTEALGSGSAATPNQSFTLKQPPLTFVQAPTPTGRQTTLQVTANQVAWTEVPSLYNRGPAEQVFSTLNQPGGVTKILFGDGVEGATLPTGQNNIQASYRVGSGASGNVAAGSVTTLMDRPLGVSGVNNPDAATGGQDPQSIDDIRANAPLSVLTLGRAVSIADYQNYAATFAGIAKAHALWIPSGPGRGVFLTVAGVNGAALSPGNPTISNLVASLQNYGNPLVPITAVTFAETLFGFSAAICCNPKYDPAKLQAQVLQTLYASFSFAARSFGQGVSVDEIDAVIQGVPGIVAVNVTGLNRGVTSLAGDLSGFAGALTVSEWNTWAAGSIPPLPKFFPDSATRLGAYLPTASSFGLPFPAEILVLNPDPRHVQLRSMS
jgi:hypothetical protein